MPESFNNEMDAYGNPTGRQPFSTGPSSSLSNVNSGGGNKGVVVVGGIGAVAIVIGGIVYFGGFLSYTCNPTQLDFGCTTCATETECTACKDGWRIDETLNGDVADLKTLKSCIFPCMMSQIEAGATKCKNASFMVECSENYEARDGICLWQCNQAQLDVGCSVCKHETQCVECNPGMSLFSDGTKTICTYDCKEAEVKGKCTGCNYDDGQNICTKCQEGYAVNKEGRCVSQCIVDGEDDLNKPLGLPIEVRNGYEWQRMCVDEEVGKFFIVGDWGGAFKCASYWSPLGGCNYIFGDGGAGDNTHHKAFGYNENGFDNRAQKMVGEQMNKRSRERKPRFVVNVGDSFYWGGFEEHGCGARGDPARTFESDRWKKCFESKYDLPHPTAEGKQIPWMGTLGNHDHGGQHYDSGWDHQIYYTYKDDGMGRWRMPGLYWNQKIYWQHFSLELFFLDGNYIDAKPPGVDASHNLCNEAKGPSNGVCEGPGYETLRQDNCASWHRTNWNNAIKWLGEKLRESKADYTGLVMHYPGNCGEPNIKGFMQTYGIDLCMVGHTHFQTMGQIINAPTGQEPGTAEQCLPSAPCDAPLEIISGGGGGISSESVASPTNNMYGFVDIEMTKDTLTARIVNQHGNENVYPVWKMPRRKKLARGEVSQ